MKIEELTELMENHRNEHAYGSECACWQDYVEDVYQQHGGVPWDVEDTEAETTLADYWSQVASGEIDHEETIEHGEQVE